MEISGVGDAIGGTVGAVGNRIGGVAAGAGEKLGGATSAVIDRARSVTETVKTIPGNTAAGIGNMGEHVAGIPGTMGDMTHKVTEPVGQAAGFVRDTISETAGTTATAISSGFDAAKETVGTGILGLRENASEVAGGAKERVGRITENALTYARGADALTNSETVGSFLEELKNLDGKNMTSDERIRALAALEVGKGVMVVELIKVGGSVVDIAKRFNPEKAYMIQKAAEILRKVQAVNDLIQGIIGKPILYDRTLHQSAREAAIKFYLTGSSNGRSWKHFIPGKEKFDDVTFAIDIAKHIGRDLFGNNVEASVSQQTSDQPEGIVDAIDADETQVTQTPTTEQTSQETSSHLTPSSS